MLHSQTQTVRQLFMNRFLHLYGQIDQIAHMLKLFSRYLFIGSTTVTYIIKIFIIVILEFQSVCRIGVMIYFTLITLLVPFPVVFW